MYRGIFVIVDKTNQMLACNLFNRPDFMSFQEGFEFAQPGGQRLNGTVRKVRKPAIIQKLIAITMKHEGTSVVS